MPVMQMIGRAIRPFNRVGKQKRNATAGSGSPVAKAEPNDPFDGLEHELVLPSQFSYYFARAISFSVLSFWFYTWRNKVISHYQFRQWAKAQPPLVLTEDDIYLDEWEDWEDPKMDQSRYLSRYTKKFRKADDANFGAKITDYK